jgi:DNA-binding SARP family transcriptional activator
VRLLGSLQVRRGDGGYVGAHEWRTSKTRHLLRLLALRAGSPVPADQLIEALWPDVDADHGRTSLRAALAQLRRVVGPEAVQRDVRGLTLTGAWVDVIAFESLVEEARQHARSGDRQQAVRIAREAIALRGGDLADDEPYADWLSADRERLRQRYVTCLVEAAESSVGLGWWRDAVDLADSALASDRASERSYRVLMRAHAHLGETEKSLRAYVACSEALAEELGADPSAETKALHMALLSAGNEPVEVPFVGRAGELQRIRAAVGAALEEGRGHAVIVRGPAGAGKTRLAREACGAWAGMLVEATCSSAQATQPRGVVEHLVGQAVPLSAERPRRLEAFLSYVTAAAPTIVLIDDLHWSDPSSVRILHFALSHADAAFVLVATVQSVDTPASEVLGTALENLRERGRCTEVDLGPLPTDVTATLVESVLGGRPSATLTNELSASTQGSPFLLIETATNLAADQQLVATAAGLTRTAGADSGDTAAQGLLRRVRETLDHRQLAVLDLCGVLGGGFFLPGLEGLVAATGQDNAAAAPAVDALEDLGVLECRDGSYEFRHAVIRSTVYGRLRPSTRRKLHDVVARHAPMPAAERIDHWAEAGLPDLACAAALQAAEEAFAQKGFEEARQHVRRALQLTDLDTATPADRLSLLELLADACRPLGYLEEAGEHLDQAIVLAKQHGLPDLARLYRKRGQALPGDSEEALSWYRRALAVADGTDARERARISLSLGTELAGLAPSEAEMPLHDALLLADVAGDTVTRVRVRATMASAVYGPQRRLAEAGASADDAMRVAAPVDDHGLRAIAGLAAQQTLTYLGVAARTIEPLREAWGEATAAGPPSLRARVGLILCLALHDLGLAEFDRRWPVVAALADRWLPQGVSCCLQIGFLTDRGETRPARAGMAACLGRPSDVLSAQIARLAASRLLEGADEAGAARQLLGGALTQAEATGGLLVPEIAARLAAIDAIDDPGAAAAYLSRAEAGLRGEVFPREQVALLLARAARLAAEGEPAGAADLAGAAAAAAGDHRLVFVRAAALLEQARHLGDAGDPAGAGRALEDAADLYERIGATAAVRRVAEARSLLADRGSRARRSR